MSEDTVWILSTGHARVYHTDPECTEVTRTGRDPIEKPLSVVDGWREKCRVCETGKTGGGSGTSTAHDLLVDMDPDDLPLGGGA